MTSGEQRATLRAGIVVTGTEVLSGAVADRNGPWLSERLREHGVEVAHIIVTGDRPDDLRAALEFLTRESVGIVITSVGSVRRRTISPRRSWPTSPGASWRSTRRSRSASGRS